MYSRVFSLDPDADALVIMNRKSEAKLISAFGRQLRGVIQLSQWNDLLSRLQDYDFTDVADRLVWDLDVFGSFSVVMMDCDSEDEGNTDPFFGLREPFSGLNEMDFELHGIYMDHEPDKEFITPLNKCKDTFLNVLLTNENIRNSSLTNDVREQVYHGCDLQSDEDEEEQEHVINKYRIHDPKTRWDKMEPKLGDMLWGIIHSQGHVFEARRGCDSYRVDLDDMTCSCWLWDLAGIPCVHANAAINFIHQTPDAYINAYFSKEKFRQCYSTNIEPVNGSNLWAQTEYIKPLPPMSRRMPGRPATKRKMHASEKESKFSKTKVKVARTTRCGNCLEYGHNKRACKNERKQYVPPPPKKTGRPRKHPIPHVFVPNQSLNERMRENNTTTPGSKRFRRNIIDAPRKKLCTRRGGERIGSAKTGNNTPTLGTQESVVQQVPVTDEGENMFGENFMQEGYNVGQSVVQQFPVVEVPTVVKEGVVQEVPVIHIQDGHMMQEGGTSQTSVMEGSETFGQVGSSIGWKLKSINDEIEQGIDAILQEVNFTNKTKSSPLNGDNEVEDNDVIKFTEGKEDDILPEKI
ncbi:unnamed protein product [Lactuca virosa]|uniref:SWIM-type domain-containing protein n=1 Tax=Lactuca virosa TaxID=75947 RepID=A0AAU9MMU7_9ASTR|nr:unnamed protein product [Lactuca virosa]